jgi:hypothetical protein
VTVADVLVHFSFRFFDDTDKNICPATFKDGYTRTLMERMRDVSRMTVQELTSNKSLRAHKHDWSETNKPNGFDCLNEQFQAYPDWQFQLSANEHGRVHGIIIHNTFYVIWLDRDHYLYSS